MCEVSIGINGVQQLAALCVHGRDEAGTGLGRLHVTACHARMQTWVAASLSGDAYVSYVVVTPVVLLTVVAGADVAAG